MKKGTSSKFNSLKMDPESFYQTREDPFKIGSKKGEKRKASLILSFLRSNNVGEFLDIGCGEGYFTEFYHANLGASKTYGCDVSETALERAKVYQSGVRYFNCNMVGKFPEKYLRNKFDSVLVSEVLYYLPDERREHAIDNIQKFCRKGCTLVVCNSQGLSFSELYTLFRPYFTLVDSKQYNFIRNKTTNILKFVKK